VTNGFDSARAKIGRAFEHRKALRLELKRYAQSKPYKEIPQPNGKTKFVLVKEPGEGISILSGEILYQCRSALDHVFFELVTRHGIPAVKNWERKCQFPLCTEQSDFPPGKIKEWISEPAFAFIERLQPYRRGDTANRLLRMLAKLSNIDKHRRLNTVVSRLTVRDTFRAANRSISYDAIHPMLNNGAELDAPLVPSDLVPILPNAVHVKRELTPIVAFDESSAGSPESCIVEGSVNQIPTLILGYIIPALM